MKKYKIISLGITLAIFCVMSISGTSCTSAQQITAEKSGAQIWGENCVRCHSIPSPSDYNDTDWETIGLHMRLRANLTADETKKVVEFLQSAN